MGTCQAYVNLMPSFEEIAKELRTDCLTENATYILGARQAYAIIDRRFKENLQCSEQNVCCIPKTR